MPSPEQDAPGLTGRQSGLSSEALKHRLITANADDLERRLAGQFEATRQLPPLAPLTPTGWPKATMDHPTTRSANPFDTTRVPEDGNNGDGNSGNGAGDAELQPQPEDNNILNLAAYCKYVKSLPALSSCSPRDIIELRMWPLADDTARALAEKKSQTAYDEYSHTHRILCFLS